MAQFGKASAKRGKPSYIYAIIGVALVLFLFGIVGWIFLNIRKSGEYFKESIQLHAFLNITSTPKQIDSVKNYIESLPYAFNVEYVSREEALEKYSKENDTLWKKMGINNPMPPSIDFYLRARYLEEDSIRNLESDLMTKYRDIISDFQTPTKVVSSVTRFVRTSTIVILVMAILLSILVIVSIDNTIRLAMYSNRFIIKTMQMVGATQWIITRPLDLRAIINGLIAAGVAIVLLVGAIFISENAVPDLKNLHDNKNIFLLCSGMILLGLFITLFSTHRSVVKYLKMKLDDLY
jgi:cell division transport system permease protein